MELIYSMRRKPLKCEPPNLDSISDQDKTMPLVTVSCFNIIAFTSLTDLEDGEGDTWGGHVYVCDLDTPWESHKVTSSVNPVSCLVWDSEGKHLLVGTATGDVTVYGQKDYLLNDWAVQYSASYPGEHIIAATFFHNGRRIVVNEKKTDGLITDRIQVLKATPIIKGFGGVPLPGAVCMSMSGAVCCVTPAANSLAAHRQPANTAALLAHHSGTVLLAGGCAGAVRAWRLRPGRELKADALPAIVLPPEFGEPTSLCWCGSEETLAVGGARGLAVWRLAERTQPVHKLLDKVPVQGNTTPGGGQKANEGFTTQWWHQVSHIPLEGVRGVSAGVGGALLAVTTAGVCYIPSYTSHHVISAPPPPAPELSPSPPKKGKYYNGSTGRPPIVSGVWCGGGRAALAVDRLGQLQLYRTAPEHATPQCLQQACSTLEYAIVTGVDTLDVLMTLKPPVLEALYDRITESFQRQPQPFQQYYYHNWLNIRIAICRMLPSCQQSASNLVSLQMLHLSWAAAAQRPDDGVTHDDVMASDGDKPECKSEWSLEAAGARGGALRALHCAAAVLATVGARNNKYELWSDPWVLSCCRRLAARGGREALARALTRLAGNAKPPHDLIEECATVSAQLSLPRLWESLPRLCVSAPHGGSLPLRLEYGVEPSGLRYTPEPPAQCDTTPSLDMDAIRYTYLGGGWRPWSHRGCGRCGSRAQAAGGRLLAQRAFDGRFAVRCRCGGNWTMYNNV